MDVSLLVSAPQKPDKKVKVRSDVLIGRGKSCNLRILSNEVSREHCRLIIGEHAVAVRDLSSGNGTLVDGVEITPETDFPVAPGARIEIGPLNVVVEYEASGAALFQTAEPQPDPGADAIVPPVTNVSVPALQEPAPQETVPNDASFDLDETTDLATSIPAMDFDPTAVHGPTAEASAADDDDEVVTDFETVDDDITEAIEEIASESEPPAASDDAVKPGKMKSLFGMFGRGKKTEPASDEPIAEEVAENDDATMPETAGEPDQDEHVFDEVLETGEESVVIGEDDAFQEEPADESAEPEFSEGSSGGFEEGDDVVDVEPDEEDAPEEDVDPGFSDFLNQFGDKN